MFYNVQEARKQAFERFHEALNTPERLQKLVQILDTLLETGSPRLQAFTAGILIDVLFQQDEDGAIHRRPRLNEPAHEKLGQVIQEAAGMQSGTGSPPAQ